MVKNEDVRYLSAFGSGVLVSRKTFFEFAFEYGLISYPVRECNSKTKMKEGVSDFIYPCGSVSVTDEREGEGSNEDSIMYIMRSVNNTSTLASRA